MKQFNYKCIVTKNGVKMYYKRVSGKNGMKWKRITNNVGKSAEKGKRKYNPNGEEEKRLRKKAKKRYMTYADYLHKREREEEKEEKEEDNVKGLETQTWIEVFDKDGQSMFFDKDGKSMSGWVGEKYLRNLLG